MMSADRTDGTPTQGQLDRSERGMLRWTRIVGLFTIVLAILAGVQAYSFIASEVHIGTSGHRVSGLESQIQAAVDRSLPRDLENSRNSEVITTQTV
jgi:hypothetical protein